VHEIVIEYKLKGTLLCSCLATDKTVTELLGIGRPDTIHTCWLAFVTETNITCSEKAILNLLIEHS
jgi:hypothetical protein